ncbi:fused response regulator/phosphatase [Stutzerimonas stutzeri]|jgi:two-component system, HptB-dependent secretion and biofilm response regulator|uniref:Histidine kinase-like protein n=1 Tax=Stutzerimonas stutzeri TaxID=316 RepID=A0A5S5B5Z4_STUST|nr:fused response regulator/phosphatase [Stutzerimonas stutzeri]TYP61756.1 histidine kinase-like protein [Stutzerimonas stutzeri]
MPGRLSILIAEDGAADRMLLAAIVRRQGHRVTTAANGAEAISLFERERPQLVLMDALMPVMDGFEAAQQIKRLAGNELVPIIFLTSLTENEALVRCLEAGGDDFIAKPYNPIILEAKIQAMHRLRRLQATVLEQRDLIGRRNQQLLDEQRAAKAIFDKVAHAGCLNAPNIRYRQSPRALFNGDLLLAAQAPAGRMFVLLGDFTGHGLPAAVGAMPLAETFYGMTAKGYSSNQILRDINAKLKLILPVEMFCCATFLDINLEQGILRVWSGGLPDGYLLKADGDWLPLRSRHLPLGVREASSFDDSFETLPLAMGDRLLLLSDGLLESRNADDQLFGEQRLLEVIEANRNLAMLFDDIQEALQAFHGQILDDLSLVEVSMLAETEEAAPHLSHVYPLGSREMRPRDWTTCFELRPSSLRTADPLPMTMQLLLQISPLRYRVGTIFTVLSELYSNAVEHGVLLLDSSIKRDAEGFASYYRERQRRLEALDEGFVSIELTVKSEGGSGYLRITVRDSGPGFDVQRALNQQYCSEQLGGRGLRMIRQLSERFYWQPDGKVLNVEFHWVGHA